MTREPARSAASPSTDPHGRDDRRQRQSPAQVLGTQQGRGTQPVAPPPNHDGMDLAELPAMHEALLSVAQVEQLLDDLQQCATDVCLTGRQAADVAGSQTALQCAVQQLTAGQINRLQIRYRWRSADWIDTLQNQADGIRLVRIRHRR